jgi:hypothetical protein
VAQNRLNAQVPNVDDTKTCTVPTITKTNKIFVNCPKCCEFNDQSNTNGPGVKKGFAKQLNILYAMDH